MQFFARLEANGFSGGNTDLGSGPRIAANAGFAWSDAEYTKPPQLNPVPGCECLFKPFEHRVHCRLRLRARQTGPLNDMMHDILLNQCCRPFTGEIEA